ncbi:MAG: hypothetical protein M3442_00760, partial [Chloroflexota bacterium]|nr:hypothetical protein [Chloroflexota bacterium]
LEIPSGAALRAERAGGLLGGITVVRGEASSPPADSPPSVPAGDGDAPLYHALRRTVDGAAAPRDGAGRRPVPFVAVPYYAWANRAAGPMLVWLRAGD